MSDEAHTDPDALIRLNALMPTDEEARKRREKLDATLRFAEWMASPPPPPPPPPPRLSLAETLAIIRQIGRDRSRRAPLRIVSNNAPPPDAPKAA